MSRKRRADAAPVVAAQYVSFANRERKLQMSMRDLIRVWRTRRAERRLLAKELASLPDETLKDFGMTRGVAYKLSHRPFWRA